VHGHPRVSVHLDKNILVISDLHLGQDLRPLAASVPLLRRLAVLARELVAFLTHYTGSRLGGRPWRLVINGDMVDFMSIRIIPDAAMDPSTATEEERLYGLGHGEPESVTKLDRVMARHPEIFSALARFIANGNELVLVVGNHDVEFHYQSVQRRLIEAMVRLGADGDRIHFCPWFYYEPDLLYVEHGHQYDEYCSFDYQLQPVVEARGGVACTVSHAGVRYFTNVTPEMNPHDAEQWNFFDYIRWMYAQGARGTGRVLLSYANLIGKLIEIWASLTDRASNASRAKMHHIRLCALASSNRIGVDKVAAIDRLRRLPVLKSFHKLLITMFLDRLLLGLTVMITVGLTIRFSHGWWKLGSSLAVLAGAVVVNYALSRLRLLDSVKLLRRVPEAIREIIQAPFIVFGHSHHAEAVALSSGGRYFNTGSWIGGPKDARAFTHVIISGDAEPNAELCQWSNGTSTPIVGTGGCSGGAPMATGTTAETTRRRTHVQERCFDRSVSKP
jgi:UDP-2,3-diacylglucosamine pyrophosphatase LpxH